MGRSAVASQRALLNVSVAKWSSGEQILIIQTVTNIFHYHKTKTSDLIPLRDSWCENSDFERAKQLLGDSLIWISFERQKLEKREKLLIENERSVMIQLMRLLFLKFISVHFI